MGDETGVQSSLGTTFTVCGGPGEGRGLGRGLTIQLWWVLQNRMRVRICRLGRAFQKPPMASGLGRRLCPPVGAVLPVVAEEAQACALSPNPTLRLKGGAQSPACLARVQAEWERLLGSTPVWGHRSGHWTPVQASFCHPKWLKECSHWGEGC